METAKLTRALNLAAPALQTKDFIPVLTHFCFLKDHVLAFDDKVAVVVFEETGLECAVPGKVLLDMLEGAGAEIELTQHTKHSELIIKDRRTTVRLPTLSSKEFLFKLSDLVDLKLGNILFPISHEVAEALDLAASLASEDAVRPALMGVSFTPEHTPHKSRVVLYSTDNVSCTKISLPVLPGKVSGGILPKSACQLIAKTSRDMNEGLVTAEVSILDGKVAVATFTHETLPTVLIVAKLIAADLENYELILSKNIEEVAWFDMPEQLTNAAKRAAVLTSSDPERIMRLTLRQGALGVEAKGRFGELGTSIMLHDLDVTEEETFNLDPLLVLRATAWASEIGLGARALAFRGTIGDKTEVTHIIARKADQK